MIARRHRPLRRTQYEQQLRDGKRDGLHEPYLVGVRDFVLHRQNFNPFRTQTPEHQLYEHGFNDMVKEFVSSWQQQNRGETPKPQHGKPTTSRFPTRCSRTPHG